MKSRYKMMIESYEYDGVPYITGTNFKIMIMFIKWRALIHKYLNQKKK